MLLDAITSGPQVSANPHPLAKKVLCAWNQTARLGGSLKFAGVSSLEFYNHRLSKTVFCISESTVIGGQKTDRLHIQQLRPIIKSADKTSCRVTKPFSLERILAAQGSPFGSVSNSTTVAFTMPPTSGPCTST